jgi:hypothetical protein
VSGSSSAVERQLPKLDVTGSIPVSRSTENLAAGPARVVLQFFVLIQSFVQGMFWRKVSGRE